MYPNLLSVILPKIDEKYHLYLRLVKWIWKIESGRAVIFPSKSILLTQFKNIFLNCKLIHLGKFPILREMHRKKSFKYACRIGDKILMHLTYRKYNSEFLNLNNVLNDACRGWQRNLMQSAINCGADNWQLGLQGACLARDLETVELMIANGANGWYDGFLNACRGGSRRIVRLMITKLKEEYQKRYQKRKKRLPKNFWREGLEKACRGGNLRIINLMIRKGADNWNGGLESACRGGSLEAVKLMIEKRANRWSLGLNGACKGGNLEIAELMLKNGATPSDDSLRKACERGNLKLVELLLERVGNSFNLYNTLLLDACHGGNLDIIKLLIKKGLSLKDGYACNNVNDVFKYMLQLILPETEK